MYHVINITKAIDHDMVEQVVDTAGYSIGYWAHTAFVDSDAETYRITWDGDETPRGEGDYTLTYREIAVAIGKIATMEAQVARFIYDGLHQWLNGNDSMDGDLADVIIQIALFDEIIYG